MTVQHDNATLTRAREKVAEGLLAEEVVNGNPLQGLDHGGWKTLSSRETLDYLNGVFHYQSYRASPPTLKYRLGLWNSEDGPRVCSVQGEKMHMGFGEMRMDYYPNFVRWLGEIQEVEV